MALATPASTDGAMDAVDERLAASSLPAAEAELLVPVIAAYLRRHPGDDISLIVRAAEMATVAHAGQTRRSGEAYVTHPIAVAGIVSDLGLDAQTVAAALLHDAVEDTGITTEVIERDFGPSVALIVEGVTKLDRLQFDSKEAQQAATVRKMLVAMANDWRVLIIKLADRLHNMRTLSVMPEWKQRSGDPRHLRAPGPPTRYPRGQVAARRPVLRHSASQAVCRDRADGGQPGPAAG
jgi:(p)ppGpp synthase/HD superfamily hydrolase